MLCDFITVYRILIGAVETTTVKETHPQFLSLLRYILVMQQFFLKKNV